MASIRYIVVGSIGILFAVAGAILLGLKVPTKIIDNEVHSQMAISTDSKMYSQWVDPPPPIYMQYYFFNVTNPDEVVNGMKPNVTELGPYTYKLHQPKFDVTFYENDTVSYKYNHTLNFMRSMSVGDEDDVITALNIPLVTIDTMIRSVESEVPKFVLDLVRGLAKFLQDSNLFINLKVNELLFGYEDPILDIASKIANLLGLTDIPGTFGVFYGFNNSDDGIYLVNTGKKNLSLANNIEYWNGNKYLPYWTTKYGNEINGTDGTFFYHDIKENQSIELYTTDVCRSLELDFDKKTEVRNVDTLRFHMTDFAFGNVSVNPDNIAYCVPDESNCYGSGVLNIGPCKQNAPVILSCPHFYMGDPKYINGVNGMKPNKELHETFLDIEPFSGSVLQAKKRLQINVEVKNSKLFPQMSNITQGKVLFPVLYLNESVYVDSGSAKELNGLFTLMGFINAIPFILFGIGAILILSLVAILLYQRSNKKKYALLVNEPGNESKPGYGSMEDSNKDPKNEEQT